MRLLALAAAAVGVAAVLAAGAAVAQTGLLVDPLPRFEEDHAALTYSLRWNHPSDARRSGGAGMVSGRTGDAMEVIFTGADVRWITTTHSTRGIAQIHIDGVDHGTVDTYGPTAFQVPVFTATGLGAGPHTLRITNTGTTHPDATGTRIEIDAIEAADVVALPRFEEDHAALTYSLRWNHPSDARRSGGAGMVSGRTGDAMEVIFTGADVRWITTTSPTRGIAQIHIDGVDHGTVDTYGPTAFQVPVFTATGLGAGPHTLRITNTGTTHPDATGTRIEIDAIEAADVVTLPRFEEDHAAVAHSAGWDRISNPHRSGGAGIVSRGGAGDAMEVIFTGADVRWITTTHSARGIAQIHIDGVDHGTVDTYGPTAFQVPVFTATGLGAGPHTLRITNTGTTHPDATHNVIEVDAIEAADVVVVDRPPVAVADDLSTVTTTTLSAAVFTTNGHGDDYLGVPAATLASFGGGDLGGDVTTHAAGSSVALAGGTLTLGADGALTLAGPAAGGVYSFDYRLANTAGDADATVTITVEQPPAAVDDAPASDSSPADVWHTALDTTLDSTTHATPPVLDNDTVGFPAAPLTSFGGGDLGGAVTDHAAGATATVDGHSLAVGADGHLLYTPKTGYTGHFTFSYRIANTLGTSDATVTIAVGERPAAVADTYPETLVANVGIDTATTATPFSVLGNDSGDDLTVTVGSPTNGEVTLDTDGTFAFDPAAGFTGGNATFTYTLTNGFGTTPPATVTIPVSAQAIWFVDDTAPACTTVASGCGRLSNPLSTLAAFQAINDGVGSNPADNHTVFLSESPTAHAGPVTLRAGQRLIGQDATSPLATLAGVSPPSHSPALPSMNPAAPTTTITGGVTLNAGNHVHGLALGDATGTALAGTTVGTLTIADVAIDTTGRALDLANGTADATFTNVSSSGGTNNVRLAAIEGTVDLGGGALSGSTSEAVLVTGGAATVEYTGTITNTANRSVAISGKTGGTVTLGGQITDTGTGIALTSNPGATIAFTGTLSLTTPATGFAATGGGTVSATGTASTLTATTGPALTIQNTAIHSNGVVFQRVSSGGGANGIVLASTGSAGGLSVTGTGTAGSGGTIQGASGDGISLSSTRDVALDRMIIQNNLGSGINGATVTNFTLANSTVSGNSDDVAADEAGMRFDNLHGAASLTNTTVSGSIEDNARVLNTSGTLALTVTGSTIRDTNPGPGGNNGLLVQASGTASITAGIHGSNFLRNRANGVQVVTNDAGTIDVDLGTTTANTYTDNNIGVSIAHNSSGTLTYDVANSTFNAPTKTDAASPINLNLGFFGAAMSGTVSGNTISNNNSLTGPGIRVISNGTGTMTVALTNNAITQVANFGIETLARDGSSTINATYTGNTITLNHLGALDGIRVTAGAVSTDTTSVCADLSGNTVSTSATNDIRVRNRFAGTSFRLEAYAGSATDMAAVAAYLQGRNTITTAAADHSGNPGFLNSAGCPTP